MTLTSTPGSTLFLKLQNVLYLSPTTLIVGFSGPLKGPIFFFRGVSSLPVQELDLGVFTSKPRSETSVERMPFFYLGPEKLSPSGVPPLSTRRSQRRARFTFPGRHILLSRPLRTHFRVCIKKEDSLVEKRMTELLLEQIERKKENKRGSHLRTLFFRNPQCYTFCQFLHR